MENKIFLNRYRLSLRRNGLPVELHNCHGIRSFRAQERDTGREVALTVVAPAPHDASTLELINSQARVAREINQINIPRLYDFGRQNSELIYVTEYCDGPTATAWIKARGPLELSAVLRVALQVVDAIAATSFLRLYHPMLNPDHLILVAGQTAEGDWPPVKIVNWFLPSAISLERMSDPGEEHPFCSPEQLQTGEADLASEVYSLGAIMFFLLTGVAPGIPADTSVASLRGIPRIVRHLLDRMLRPSASERPHDPIALAAFLQTCLRRVERREKIGRRFALPVLAQPRLAKEKSSRQPVLLFSVAVALGLLIVSALGMIFFQWPRVSERTVASRSANPGRNIVPQVPAPIPGNRSNEVAASKSDPNGAGKPQVPDSTGKVPDSSGQIVRTSPEMEPPPAEGPSEETPSAELYAEKSSSNLPAPIIQSPTNESGGEVPNEKPTQLAQSKHPSDETTTPEIVQSDETSKRPVTPSNETDRDETATQSAEIPESAHGSSSHPATKLHRKSIAHHLANHDRQKREHRIVHTVKRGRAVPALHVGQSAAQLVGTTRDGRWILFVADSGQRIIVPPPPGYGD